MTSVLNTQKIPEIEVEAANGRFLMPGSTDLQLFPPEVKKPEGKSSREIRQCIASQKQMIEDAQVALIELRGAQLLRKIGQECVGVLCPDALEEARLESVDKGAVWRSCTDKISNTIASRFPNQVLNDPIFDTEEAVYITSAHKLYKIDSDSNVWCFSSYMDQIEMNKGVRMASDDMWEHLLQDLSVVAAVNSGQSHS